MRAKTQRSGQAEQGGKYGKRIDDVASPAPDAFAEERFLILTDPIAQDWMEFKTSDPEKWLTGMRRLQARIEAAE